MNSAVDRLVAFVLVVISTQGGCALWKSNEEIIRMESQRKTDLARRLTLVGTKRLAVEDIDGAAEKFRAAVVADESYAPAHNNLGLLHYEQGNLYQAALAFDKALQFMPEQAMAAYNLALVLESAGRTPEARELYERAIRIEPANPVYLGNLVRLQVRMGETGPIVTQRLKKLVLIETRPDWRAWADELLGLKFNDALDRGPSEPELEFGKDDADSDAPIDLSDRIIELTPVGDSVDDFYEDSKMPVEEKPREELPKPASPELMVPSELNPPTQGLFSPAPNSDFSPENQVIEEGKGTDERDLLDLDFD